MRRALLALAVSVALTGVTLAGPLEDGERAYGRGDYVTALRLWRPLAERGNVVAQHNHALLYDTGGSGVPQDEVEAARWYYRAAEQADASAQNALGVMYLAGRGT